MFILSTHILLAIIMTFATLFVFAAGYWQTRTWAYRPMLGSFGLTAISGIGLLLAEGRGLGRFCVMMSGFALAIIIARAYYRARLVANAA